MNQIALVAFCVCFSVQNVMLFYCITFNTNCKLTFTTQVKSDLFCPSAENYAFIAVIHAILILNNIYIFFKVL